MLLFRSIIENENMVAALGPLVELCTYHSVEGGQCKVQALRLGMSGDQGSVCCGSRRKTPGSHDLEYLHHAAAMLRHQQGIHADAHGLTGSLVCLGPRGSQA